MISPPAAISASGRLLTIDMLRGFAAMAVLLFHASGQGLFSEIGQIHLPSSWLKIGIYPASYGFAGVYLFFVLSGFCIHLRWVKNQVHGGGEKPLEFVTFWKRRFKRLYPAYLAALLLYIGASWQLGDLQLTTFFVWDLTSHLLMLHNLDPRTVYSIKEVFWTLAIEEQLYLAYFLLIWLRTRYGWMITLSVTFAARAIWFALAFLLIRTLEVQVPVLESAMTNWFIWTLGAISVEARYGMLKLPSWCYSTMVATLSLLLASMHYSVDWLNGSVGYTGKAIVFVLQPLWGIGFFILLNKVATLESILSRFSVVRSLAYVGTFSYSLYLVHELAFLFVPSVPWPTKAVIALLFAWVFYVFFQKPFINVHRPTSERVAFAFSLK